MSPSLVSAPLEQKLNKARFFIPPSLSWNRIATLCTGLVFQGD
jgi:hypothetical protein